MMPRHNSNCGLTVGRPCNCAPAIPAQPTVERRAAELIADLESSVFLAYAPDGYKKLMAARDAIFKALTSLQAPASQPALAPTSPHWLRPEPVGGISLRKAGKYTEVWVFFGNVEHLVIRDLSDNSFSHEITAEGLRGVIEGKRPAESPHPAPAPSKLEKATKALQMIGDILGEYDWATYEDLIDLARKVKSKVQGQDPQTEGEKA